MTPPARSNPATMAAHAVRGFCMGVADIVPGVSGGTIALILGIYSRLVANIRTGAGALGRLVRGDLGGFTQRMKTVEWLFLAPLLAGIGVAFVSLAHLIETLLHDHPEEMAGLFLGLVAASVIIAAKMVRVWERADLASAAVVAVVSFFALGLQTGAVSNPSPWQFLGAGAIAICAMILPGISGSFLLLMLGMYAPLLHAVNERELPDVAVFLVGATIGLALFSTLLSWLLEHHYDQVLAALIGLMIGSVRVLWPWPRGVGIISDEADELVNGTDLGWPDSFAEFFWPTLLATLAFVAVMGLSLFADRRSIAAAERSLSGSGV